MKYAMQGERAPELSLPRDPSTRLASSELRYVSPIEVNPGAEGILDALDHLRAEAA